MQQFLSFYCYASLCDSVSFSLCNYLSIFPLSSCLSFFFSPCFSVYFFLCLSCFSVVLAVVSLVFLISLVSLISLFYFSRFLVFSATLSLFLCISISVRICLRNLHLKKETCFKREKISRHDHPLSLFRRVKIIQLNITEFLMVYNNVEIVAIKKLINRYFFVFINN